MKSAIRVYGSVFVLLSGVVCGFFTVALFVEASWVIETLGLLGFGVYVVWTVVIAVISLSFDLIGNAREAL
jgi:spore coat protein U-like protein